MNNQTSLSKVLADSMSGEITNARKDALTEELKNHVIDTCYATDTEEWETGIEPKGKEWVVVEQYPNKEKAIIGHKKWVEKVKKTPKINLEEIMEPGF